MKTGCGICNQVRRFEKTEPSVKKPGSGLSIMEYAMMNAEHRTQTKGFGLFILDASSCSLDPSLWSEKARRYVLASKHHKAKSSINCLVIGLWRPD
jgi:hypothetical protein